jgi:prevent-host-death family protein
MASEVSVHEAKTHLSRLLRRVAAGEEIIIARAGKPIAILTAIGKPRRRELGIDEGKFVVPDDFDAPLPDELLEGFEQ